MFEIFTQTNTGLTPEAEELADNQINQANITSAMDVPDQISTSPTTTNSNNQLKTSTPKASSARKRIQPKPTSPIRSGKLRLKDSRFHKELVYSESVNDWIELSHNRTVQLKRKADPRELIAAFEPPVRRSKRIIDYSAKQNKKSPGECKDAVQTKQ